MTRGRGHAPPERRDAGGEHGEPTAQPAGSGSLQSGVNRRELIVLFVVTVVVLVPLYALTATYEYAQVNDTRSTAQAGWSVATTGDLAFDERWSEDDADWAVEGRDGRLYSNRFPGILAISAVAYGVAVTTGVIDARPIEDPRDIPYGPAGAAAFLIAVLAAALTYLVFRELPVSRNVAIIAGTFVAIGTPLWSVSANALWTHGPTHALLAGMLLALRRDRTVIAACLAAALVTVRPHLGIAAVVLAFAASRWSGRATVVAGSLVGLALVAAYSMWIFGQPLPAAGYNVDRFVEGSIPLLRPSYFGASLLAWLLEPNTGILVYVPLVLIAAPRLPAAWNSSPQWVRPAALAGVAYAVVQLSLARSTGGLDFFGHRTTIELFVLTAPLLLMALLRVRQVGLIARSLVSAAVVYSVALHAYGAHIGGDLFHGIYTVEQETQALAEPLSSLDPVDHAQAEAARHVVLVD